MSPATSEAQRRLMCLALSIKKGDTPKSERNKQATKMAEQMSIKQLEDYCKGEVQES